MESDAGTDSTAAQHDRPPPRLDNTEWFVIIPAEYNVKQLHKIGIYKVCAYCSNIDLRRAANVTRGSSLSILARADLTSGTRLA